jgi:hypothetical protein
MPRQMETTNLHTRDPEGPHHGMLTKFQVKQMYQGVHRKIQQALGKRMQEPPPRASTSAVQWSGHTQAQARRSR